MFFTFSKIIWFCIQPLNFISLLCTVGLCFYILGLKTISKAILIISLTLFLICGVVPLGPHLLKTLEDTYPTLQVDELPEHIDGVIVLGGMLNTPLSYNRDQPVFNKDVTRLTTFIHLKRIYPDAKFVVSGGSGSLHHQDKKPYPYIKQILQDSGLDPSSFIFETQSRNTYENYKNSFDLITPKAGQRWILITSAFHMPRSVAVFCSGKWPVIPFPVAYMTPRKIGFGMQSFNVLVNFQQLHVALKEWIGIVTYRLFDKTSILFPPPLNKGSKDVTPIICR